MKNLFLLFCLIISLSSCNQNEEEIINDNSIVGTWKLIEKTASGNDGLPIWKPVSDAQSYTYTFFEDGLVIISTNSCNGVYNLNSSNTIIKIVYDCNNSKSEGSFNFTFERNDLIL
ncbi:MAG: hypothetical protein Q7U59_11500, partial [Lutibacter sp.]|nr:hypothetical protein [Lutibacter sp.]